MAAPQVAPAGARPTVAGGPGDARADEGLVVGAMTVALLVMCDGRDEYLGAAIASAEANLRGSITERVLHDDSGDDAYRRRLAGLYPAYRHIGSGPRRGFAGAYAHAWAYLTAESEATWVANCEQDYTYNRPVDLSALAAALTVRPYLAQMALRRQPWGPEEIAAGGFVQMQPDAYTDVTDPALGEWLEHTLYLTSNPSLYRRALCSVGWPPAVRTGHGTSEAVLAQQLLRDGLPWGIPGDQVRFGFWGPRSSAPLVHHIGEVRIGYGY